MLDCALALFLHYFFRNRGVSLACFSVRDLLVSNASESVIHTEFQFSSKFRLEGMSCVWCSARHSGGFFGVFFSGNTWLIITQAKTGELALLLKQ